MASVSTQPTYVSHADAVGVVAVAVRTWLANWSSTFDTSIWENYIMISDITPAALFVELAKVLERHAAAGCVACAVDYD